MLNKQKVKKPVLSLIALAVIAVGGGGISSSAMAEKSAPTMVDKTNEVALDSQAKEEVSGGSSGELISVKPSDEILFSPEEWKRILSQIEKGVISWEDEDGNVVPNDVEDREATYNPKEQKVKGKSEAFGTNDQVEEEK